MMNLMINLMSTASTLPLTLINTTPLVQSGPTADSTAITADSTTVTADSF